MLRAQVCWSGLGDAADLARRFALGRAARYHEPLGADRWDDLVGSFSRPERRSLAGWPATVNRRGHFSMLITQLGHITEAAATDWLQPNAGSPERADSAAWIGEVLEEPHTREPLETILEAARGRRARIDRTVGGATSRDGQPQPELADGELWLAGAYTSWPGWPSPLKAT